MKVKSYMMSSNEANLYSNIKDISMEIVSKYKEICKREIENRELDDKTKKELYILLKKEKTLYNEVMKKSDRAEAFYFITARPGSDVNQLLSEDYGDALKLAFDSKACFRRMRSNLDVFVKNYHAENMDESTLNKITNNFLPAELFKKIAIKSTKQENSMCRVLYMDIFNAFLNLLEDEINKPLNSSIREDLICAKYNIISSNVWIEDKYINDDFKINDSIYTSYNIIKNLFGFDDIVMEKILEIEFEKELRQIINSTIILGDKNFTNDNYKNILVNYTMLKAILLVTDSQVLEKSCKNYLNEFSDKINTNNIGNYLINNYLKTKPDKNKVLIMKLFTNE